MSFCSCVSVFMMKTSFEESTNQGWTPCPTRSSLRCLKLLQSYLEGGPVLTHVTSTPRGLPASPPKNKSAASVASGVPHGDTLGLAFRRLGQGHRQDAVVVLGLDLGLVDSRR